MTSPKHKGAVVGGLRAWCPWGGISWRSLPWASGVPDRCGIFVGRYRPQIPRALGRQRGLALADLGCTVYHLGPTPANLSPPSSFAVICNLLDLLKTTKLLGYLPVKVSPHRTLTSSKFVIKCEELDTMQAEEIKKNFSHKGSLLSKESPIRYSLYVLTIKGHIIPKKNPYWIFEKRNMNLYS